MGSPPYMHSEFNFEPLYLKNYLTDPRQTWTQASHDQSLSFETKKKLVQFFPSGRGEKTKRWVISLTPPHLRQIRRGIVHHAFHKKHPLRNMQPNDFVYEIPDTRTSQWLETVSTCSAKGAFYGSVMYRASPHLAKSFGEAH